MSKLQGAVLNVHDAELHTATITVQALKVDGRQVTMAVFRQLLTEPIIGVSNGLLVGKPWGTVNYFFGKCDPDHLHVVWQKGTELRRACVWPDDEPTGYRYWRRQRCNYSTARAACDLLVWLESDSAVTLKSTRYSSDQWRVTWGRNGRVVLPRTCFGYLHSSSLQTVDRGRVALEVETLMDGFCGIEPVRPWGAVRDELTSEIARHDEMWAEIAATRKKSVDYIQSTPQLFIAT